MPRGPDPFAGWTAEQIALGRLWVRTWKHAGPALERIRMRELRELNAYEAIALLVSSGSPVVEAPRPSSGLVEQQRWFAKGYRHS